jgi:hypothetical protein
LANLDAISTVMLDGRRALRADAAAQPTTTVSQT